MNLTLEQVAILTSQAIKLGCSNRQKNDIAFTCKLSANLEQLWGKKSFYLKKSEKVKLNQVSIG